jgi:hypothetical protein
MPHFNRVGDFAYLMDVRAREKPTGLGTAKDNQAGRLVLVQVSHGQGEFRQQPVIQHIDRTAGDVDGHRRHASRVSIDRQVLECAHVDDSRALRVYAFRVGDPQR